MRTTMKRVDVLAKLQAQLPIAQGYDARVLAEHQIEEREWERRQKESMREGLKKRGKAFTEWAVSTDRWGGKHLRGLTSPPACPLSQADAFTKAIRFLERDARTNISIDSDRSTANHDLYVLLMWEPEPKKSTVC